MRVALCATPVNAVPFARPAWPPYTLVQLRCAHHVHLHAATALFSSGFMCEGHHEPIRPDNPYFLQLREQAT